MPQKNAYEKIISLLKTMPHDASAAVMIRHSERENTNLDVVPYDTPLTPEGFRMAEHFGRSLPQNFDCSFWTSPVPRCRQTGEGLLRGLEAAGKQLPEMKESTLLGRPGAYVSDRDAARNMFMQTGTIGLVNKYLNEGILPAFNPLKEGSANLTSFLLQNMNVGNISINISHDATISTLLGDLTGIRFSQKNWISYLSGIVIVEIDGMRTLYYEGVPYETKL